MKEEKPAAEKNKPPKQTDFYAVPEVNKGPNEMNSTFNISSIMLVKFTKIHPIIVHMPSHTSWDDDKMMDNIRA